MTEAETWSGFEASANQALEWGIALAGALAHRHAAGDVVGGIACDSISRPRFGPPTLPASGMPGMSMASGAAVEDPDRAGVDDIDPVEVESGQRSDVADLAAAVLAIIGDPPPVVAVALTGGPVTAVALGERLQEAQRSLGLPVAPIPFAGAANGDIGGRPIEVPPAGISAIDPPITVPADPEPAATAPAPDPRFDPAELARQPNMRLLALALVAMLVFALAIGIGWR